MAMNGPAANDPAANDPLLACGRDATEVWDRSGLPRDAHELACPHCAATIADAHGLDGLVQRLAEQPLVAPPSVLDRVMGAVRTELRPHDVLPLESPHGPAAINRPAAAAVLRRTVDRMDGVRARSCRIEPVAGGGVDIRVTVTARFGIDVPSIMARARQLVAAAGGQVLGVVVRRVDIVVTDVFEDQR